MLRQDVDPQLLHNKESALSQEYVGYGDPNELWEALRLRYEKLSTMEQVKLLVQIMLLSLSSCKEVRL
jgi:hypothetical protein